MMPARHAIRLSFALLVAVVLAGCSDPKSIFEIADDYLLGNPNLKRAIVEDIIKEEADKRGIAIH